METGSAANLAPWRASPLAVLWEEVCFQDDGCRHTETIPFPPPPFILNTKPGLCIPAMVGSCVVSSNSAAW